MSASLLVVDKSKTVESLAKEALNPLGHNVIIASSVALALFLANKNQPSAIVFDVSSIEDHGLDLLKELRADEDLRPIPVLISSRQAIDADMMRELHGLGALKILPHHMSAEEFLEEVEPFLLTERDKPEAETTE